MNSDIATNDYLSKGSYCRSIRALHVIPSLDVATGGPVFALRALLQGLLETGVIVEVATTGDAATIVRTDGAIHHIFGTTTSSYTVSARLFYWLLKNCGRFDIVHIHALFSFPSTVAALSAGLRGVPYILRPLGVLNRWGLLNRRPLCKKLSLMLCEGPLLRRAAAVHFTAFAEEREASLLGIQMRSVVIPNAVEAPTSSLQALREEFFERYPHLTNSRLVLFLSRLDVKKGVEHLLDAVPTIRSQMPAVKIMIAGGGEGAYVASLMERCRRLGIENCVQWVGFLKDRAKWAALASTDLFVLPSYSENFGVSVCEAMAVGTPVVIGRDVALSREVEALNAGSICAPTSADVAAAVLCELSRERSPTDREGVRSAIAQRYSPRSVGTEVRRLYEGVLNSTEGW